jgi:predicted TIM-barrel fold metal-dependent hydrolase
LNDLSSAEFGYDVHAHVGLDRTFWEAGWWPYASMTQDLLEKMDSAGVGRAVCFPFCTPSAFDTGAFVRDRQLELLPGRVPFDRENPLLVREIERIDGDGRLLPFAMFDPGRKVPEQLSRLESLLGSIHGLKTQTTVLRSRIGTLLDEAKDLMAFAMDHNLPVVIHTALLPEDLWARVEDCLEVAAAYPAVRFNLAHSLRFHGEYLRRASELPNVWVDCSAHLVHCYLAERDSPVIAPKSQRIEADFGRPARVLDAVYEVLGDRYLWGSDNPYMSWCDDESAHVYSYGQEAQVLRSVPARTARSMSTVAPRAWLFGEEEGRG